MVSTLSSYTNEPHAPMIAEIVPDRLSIVESLLEEVAPDQIPFVIGDHFAHGTRFCFGWFEGEELFGCISYCIRKIGEEQKTTLVTLEGKELTEAKVSGFAVKPASRNQGIGKALHQHIMEHAKSHGCYQLASYSTFEKVENHSVKLSLGFCVQPEIQPDGTMGCFFSKATVIGFYTGPLSARSLRPHKDHRTKNGTLLNFLFHMIRGPHRFVFPGYL